MKQIPYIFAAVCGPLLAGDPSILYTGRLLGYGRTCFMEEYRSPGPAQNRIQYYSRTCPGPPTAYSTALQRLLKATKKRGDLLLGAGDNFSLDFGAREAALYAGDAPRTLIGREKLSFVEKQGWVNLADSSESVPANGEPGTTIDGDTVADFIRGSGYDALVPGKHDFYFGPERLRQIGRLLMRPEKGRAPVRMLAANLVIQAAPIASRVQLAATSRFRKPNFDDKHQSIKLVLPEYVLPWMRRVRVENAIGEKVRRFGELRLCEAENVDKQQCSDKNWKSGEPPTLAKDGFLVLEARGFNDYSIVSTEYLDPAKAYHLCAMPAGNTGGRPYCQAFHVEQPFFDYGGPVQKPYLVRGNWVVFGAVAIGLEGKIGKLNTQWNDPNGVYELAARALDPLEAMRQTLDYCVEAQDCDFYEGAKRRILLAQMPPAAARLLNDRLMGQVEAHVIYREQEKAGKSQQTEKGANETEIVSNMEVYRATKEPSAMEARIQAPKPFALVIAEADEKQYTPFLAVNYPPGYPALTVTPKPPYLGAMKLSVHIQSVSFEGDAVSSRGTGSGTPTIDATVNGVDSQDFLSGLVAKALKQEGLKPNPADPAGNFRELTLAVMRREGGHASAAMVQKRDLFETQYRLERVAGLGEGARANERIRAIVDGILWKGDYLVTRYVKGAALKRIMDQSELFNRLDSDPYSDNDETQRGLAVFGVDKDPETKGWVIDGEPVADDTMYKIATTDFLAFGDTGYPELNKPAVGKPQQLSHLQPETPHQIAERVYESLAYADSPKRPPNHKTQNQSSALHPKTTGCPYPYLVDCLQWRQAPEAPIATTLQQFWDYFHSVPTPDLPELRTAHKSQLPNRTAIQVRPIWKLNLEKAAFSVNRYRHNQGNQSTLERGFNGIPESGVLAPDSSKWSWEWALELRRERLRSLDFLRLEGAFSKAVTQQNDDSPLTAYAQNSASVEAGWRGSIRSTVRQTKWAGVLVSGLFSTQQFNPRSKQTVKYPGAVSGAVDASGCTSETPPVCSQSFDALLGRTTRLSLKSGWRAEWRDSWLEAGAFAGSVRRPIKYKLTGDEMENSVQCDLAVDTLGGCLDQKALSHPFAVLTQQSVARFGPETGLFLNGNWKLPVTADGRLKIEMTNRGRWQFRHPADTLFDTRLSNVFTLAFSAPIAGGLTFRPTWTLFHFLNKANARGASTLLMGNTVDLSLNYSFRWRSGQSRWKALRYGNGK